MPDPASLDAARDALNVARERTAAAARDEETASRSLAELTATHGAGDARVGAAKAARDPATRALSEARGAERAALTDLRVRTAGVLSAEPVDPLGGLDTSYPIALLPVRIETRFAVGGPQPELWLRVYPDEIVAHQHTPELTAGEIAAGQAYWTDAWNPSQAATAWGRLVKTVPLPRAAWIARATSPTNLAARPAGQPTFPALTPSAAGAARAPEARLLPDRWIVLGYRGGTEVLRGTGSPIREPLALALAPPGPDDTTDPALVDVSGDGLTVDTESAWTVDFDQAISAGMGLRLPLSADDAAQGFERLIVLGVKSTLGPDEAGEALAGLLDEHHFARGWAFVAQGTPTNNTSGQPTPFPPEDPTGAISFAVEQGESLATPDHDGVRFARTLGIPPDVVAHVAGADRREQRLSAAMNDALWPVAWGYFLEQMMAPVATPAAIAEIRRHFVDHVRGRGPSPAFRIGGTPYGLLPVTALGRWAPDPAAGDIDRGLPRLLQTLRPTWAAAVTAVPRIGRTDDPDADLLSTLGMDASAREVRVRRVTGPDFQQNLHDLFGLDSVSWSDLQQAVAHSVLTAIGHPEWAPRVLSMTFADDAPRFRMPFVADPPLSETDGLVFDYVAWILGTGFGPLQFSRVPTGVVAPRALLYYMLRHSTLLEYGRLMLDVLVRSGQAQVAVRREPELVRVVAGTETQQTAWEQMAQPVPGVTGTIPLTDALLAATPARLVTLGGEHAQLDAYRASLGALVGVPTAELERLFTETLDVSSHRLDAWITSLASKRLEAMRDRQPLGLHLGAYGWVEDLHPAPTGRVRLVSRGTGPSLPVQTNSGGHVHAPSMSHAATAAVLRNAYLSRTGADRVRYAVDLSSSRVRRARTLLDGVRNGQPLGALLGYQLERGLHEGHPGFELDRYIEPLRIRFPLVADKGGPSGEPVEQVAARDVVDGLALRAAWTAGTFTLGSGGLDAVPADQPAIEAELRALDDTVDAVADLLLAESVHQVVVGSVSGATASLDAMAQGGVRPPDPAVAQLPRGGVTLTHRVAVVLGGAPLAEGPWATVPLTPRARAEPRLDRWIGQILGDPATVRCRVRYPDPTPADPTRRGEVTVSLTDLGLRPLDVLALAAGAEAEALAAEVDQRVAFAAMSGASGDVGLEIRYERADGWEVTTTRTFPELLELARAIFLLVQSARPLGPADLQTPEVMAPPVPDDSEARARGAEAKTALDAARTALDAAAAQVGGGSPDLGPLRTALVAASLFGVVAAVPTSRRSTGDAPRAALLAQAESVALELGDRSRRAAAAADAPEMAREIFGRDFALIPSFAPPRPAELDEALAAGPTLGASAHDVTQWLQQAQRARPALGRWRRVWLYASALGRPVPRLELAQLPRVPGESWVGLAFGVGARHQSGRLSLVLHRAVAPSTTEPWAGLVIDEWPEVIPSRTETTGLAFHYDDPGAEAPQAVLIAVPPGAAPRWDLATLAEIVRDALDLAKLRGVDGDFLGLLGQILPAIYLSTNVKDDTVSTDFKGLLIADRPLVRSEG